MWWHIELDKGNDGVHTTAKGLWSSKKTMRKSNHLCNGNICSAASVLTLADKQLKSKGRNM